MYMHLLDYSWNISGRSTKKCLVSKEKNWLIGILERERLG